ncbi:MAG TPA: hypothetical protein PK773_05550 [Aminivibrio sp.]|nr:hypothetical protein [Aminivibrio sp.]
MRGSRERRYHPTDQAAVPEGAWAEVSDHLILDVEDSASSLAQGDKLKFFPDYGAMLALATSPYVPFEVV